MKDEFDYTMTKLGSEYDYQSKFATDEANRELNKLTHQGNIEANLSEQKALKLCSSLSKVD